MNRSLTTLLRPHILSMKPYSSARDEFQDYLSDRIFLDANENPYPNGLNRYPDPYQKEVKSLLAQQKGLHPNQLLLGNGSDEVLDLIFRVFCEPGRDHIFTLPPTYGMYSVLAEVNQVENKEILLTTDFQPDTAAILKEVNAHSKLLFLCAPNNPTGNDFEEDAIEKLLNDFPGIVVIDEAYIDFSPRRSYTGLLNAYKNLIVVQTLSKAYAHAGIRLGMAWSSPEIIGYLNKIKPPYNVNQLTQQQALICLKDIQKVRNEVEIIKKEREKLSAFFRQLDFVAKVYPSDANFILLKVDDAQKRYRQFLENGIVVRNRSQQPRCENTLRITVGTAEENQKLMQICTALNAK